MTIEEARQIFTLGTRVRRGNNVGTIAWHPWPDQIGTPLVSVRWDTEVLRNSGNYNTLETARLLEVIR